MNNAPSNPPVKPATHPRYAPQSQNVGRDTTAYWARQKWANKPKGSK